LCIENVRSLHPTFSGNPDTIGDVFEAVYIVSIWINTTDQASLFGKLAHPPIQIQPLGIGIEPLSLFQRKKPRIDGSVTSVRGPLP
jgi:hypothetical protein